MSRCDQWKREYNSKGIPSSYREEPSRSVVWFREQLEPQTGRILDLGCGRGRNSRYLAGEGFDVDAVDWVEENIAALQGIPKLTARCSDLTGPFPFASDTFDAAIDIFCFKHITTDQQHYLQEVSRVLKTGGFYFLSLASKEDGYYGPLLGESDVICDPVAGVESVLFTPESLEETLKPYFQIQQIKQVESVSDMHGKSYQRSMLWAVAQILDPLS